MEIDLPNKELSYVEEKLLTFSRYTVTNIGDFEFTNESRVLLERIGENKYVIYYNRPFSILKAISSTSNFRFLFALRQESDITKVVGFVKLKVFTLFVIIFVVAIALWQLYVGKSSLDLVWVIFVSGAMVTYFIFERALFRKRIRTFFNGI